MKKTDIAKILEWHNSGTLKTDEAVERICSLFDVVGQSEQLCDKCNREKQLQKLTDQAQELNLGYDD
jgi:alcohol dehydrogenase class IV